MSKACVFFADGFEEVEALTVVDLLRRAGIDTTMVSISDSLQIVGRTRIPVMADQLFDKMDYSDIDLFVLPGGQPGTTYLGQHKGLTDLIVKEAKKKKIAAICAAPTVLGALGLLKGKKATCYPGCEDALKGAKIVQSEKVVQDDNITTSRGVGTAIPFALSLIEQLLGKEAAKQVASDIVYHQ